MIQNRHFCSFIAGDNHKGIQDFVFWNLGQVQHKNPNVQIVELKNMTPSPFITCFLEDGISFILIANLS